MDLYIKHNPSINIPASATLLPGNNALVWLKEIDSWNISLDELETYLIPKSNSSIETAGLFIIFKNPKSIQNIALLQSYYCKGESLYLPLQTELLPAIKDKELKTLLLWHRQLFHPSIGFIGFEMEDQVQLSDFLDYKEPQSQDWSFARYIEDVLPQLKKISIQPPKEEELIDSMKEDVGSKPLDEIPNKASENDGPLEKYLDWVKFGFYKIISGSIRAVIKILPEGSPGAGGNEGMLQKLQNWIELSMEEIEKKRMNEIKRLLNLFDENNNEALQYAIPLNSPYLNRGNSTKGTSLLRRSTDFSLKGLGGGRAVDGWDLGDNYFALKDKYSKAAENEIRKKDFKKAAYIYAHLLGDYNSAANVLEQGGYHREAAVLYKDHLKNLLAGAECLERGGLLIEAIDCYRQLNMTEKSGDLYRKLEQETLAEECYEKCIESKLSGNDYLEASRVIEEKMRQQPRAKQTLLEGWKDSLQSESCLKKYFEIVLKSSPETTEKEAKDIFRNKTPEFKKLSFLNVLDYVQRKKQDPDFSFAAQDIAYEIANQSATKGNYKVLQQLKSFFPADKLLSSDTHRYSTLNKSSSDNSRFFQDIQLDKDVKWKKALWHRNQFLIFGISEGTLVLARGNWYGNLEYYKWTSESIDKNYYEYLLPNNEVNVIVISSAVSNGLTKKDLPKNKYFPDALFVKCPSWLQNKAKNGVIDKDGHLWLFNGSGDNLSLSIYSIEGNLIRSIACKTDKEKAPVPDLDRNEISHWRNCFYTYYGNVFYSITNDGLVNESKLGTGIRLFASAHRFLDTWLVLSTNKGCLLCKSVEGGISIPSKYFAIELTPGIIAFISKSKLVMVENKKAVVFEIVEETPLMRKEFHVDLPIIAALPTISRNEFAVLMNDGKMVICDF